MADREMSLFLQFLRSWKQLYAVVIYRDFSSFGVIVSHTSWRIGADSF
jgi:hypothetical protein